jgi:hypothetical protein
MRGVEVAEGRKGLIMLVVEVLVGEGEEVVVVVVMVRCWLGR